MGEGDGRFEAWWNGLTSEFRTDVLKLVPTMGIDQQALFSQRLWHELHGWLRDDVRRGVRSDFKSLLEER